MITKSQILQVIYYYPEILLFVNYIFFKKKEHGGAEAVGGLRASWA